MVFWGSSQQYCFGVRSMLFCIICKQFYYISLLLLSIIIIIKKKNIFIYSFCFCCHYSTQVANEISS